MDIDPVAVDFRHCDFLANSRRYPGEDNVQLRSGRILTRSLRDWEMRKCWTAPTPVHFDGARKSRMCPKTCRSAQPIISKFYSLRRIPNCIASHSDRYHP